MLKPNQSYWRSLDYIYDSKQATKMCANPHSSHNIIVAKCPPSTQIINRFLRSYSANHSLIFMHELCRCAMHSHHRRANYQRTPCLTDRVTERQHPVKLVSMTARRMHATHAGLVPYADTDAPTYHSCRLLFRHVLYSSGDPPLTRYAAQCLYR